MVGASRGLVPTSCKTLRPGVQNPKEQKLLLFGSGCDPLLTFIIIYTVFKNCSLRKSLPILQLELSPSVNCVARHSVLEEPAHVLNMPNLSQDSMQDLRR